MAYHDGSQFSTFDEDNDKSWRNCATHYDSNNVNKYTTCSNPVHICEHTCQWSHLKLKAVHMHSCMATCAIVSVTHRAQTKQQPRRIQASLEYLMVHAILVQCVWQLLLL